MINSTYKKNNSELRKHGALSLKVLTVAALIGLQSFGNSAFNEVLASGGEDLTKTTLGENSAYKLTEVSAAGGDTLTKYVYDEATGKINEVHYKVELKQTSVGSGDTSDGAVGVKLFDSSVYVDLNYNSNVANKYRNIDYEYPTLTNPTGTSSSEPYVFAGKNAYYNPSGSTTSVEDSFFGYNDLSATLESTETGSTYANVFGGALYNEGNLTEVSADFVENRLKGETINTQGDPNITVGGGALYNTGTMGTINGDYIYNSASAPEISYGGAIYNEGTIDNITGDYARNLVRSTSGVAYGGAISNSFGTINNINGIFLRNDAYSSDFIAFGGAIFNDFGSEIENISAHFIGNSAEGESNAFGGAIYNDGTIDSVTGDFISNYVETESRAAHGGAIDNAGEIKTVNGDFVNNYAKSVSGSAFGGAIYNSGEIKTLKGNFLNNYAESDLASARGGAIRNMSKIDNIEGNFLNNYTMASDDSADGGAILNIGEIKTVNGDFVNNYAKGDVAFGGAISNTDTIGEITGDFQSNYVEADSFDALGGAIDNEGEIKTINGDFVNNYAKSISGIAQGGAIFVSNAASIGNISGNFQNNHVESDTDDARGGAIYSEGTIDSITGDFVSNSVKSGSDYAHSGAIFVSNAASIGNISGNFQNNHVESDTNIAYGGAISSLGTIDSITGDFVSNAVKAGGEEAFGGAIYNVGGSINTLNGNFEKNNVQSSGKAQGGAIYNNNGTIGTLEGNFVENSIQASGVALGGAIYNVGGSINSLKGNFVENYSHSTSDNALGGAIYNEEATIELVNSSFIGNYAKSDTSTAQGGAIYTTTSLNLIADGKHVEIRDNYTESAGVRDDNAIYLASDSTLTLEIKNNGSLALSDNIDGVEGSTTNITGDNTGTLLLHNDIKTNVAMGNVNLNTINNATEVLNMNSLALTGDVNMAVDVDLKNSQMDRLSAKDYGQHTGNINVTGFNIMSDAKSDNTSILFAQNGLKDNVTLGANEAPTNDTQLIAYTPIYKYNVSYDNSGDDGYFLFNRANTGTNTGGGDAGSSTGGGTGGNSGGSNGAGAGSPSYEAFNPAVLASSTTSAVGSIGTMNQTMNYAFSNVDKLMSVSSADRFAMKNKNTYAISTSGDMTDMGRFSPLYQAKDETSSIWVKPYSTFENVPIKNGPKVSNITYGTLVGYDSDIYSMRHGWDRVWTGFIGYNGASQRFAGVDSSQNGGLLGGTMTLYKGNFFNATTVNLGVSTANNHTMYGSENFSIFSTGVGNKLGYNFEYKDGKVILQPSMLMSYYFINTSDYNNAANVRIENDPLHVFQLAPGVKVIGNMKNGWQPYASVSMIWNIMGSSDSTANGVYLPNMTIKPYVQYGLGLQRHVSNTFTAYGQAMVQNGGRNGVSLTAGMRWALD